MNLTKADIILDEIRQAVSAIAAKHGCALKPHRGSFSIESVMLKLELTETLAGGKPIDFDKCAHTVGLPSGSFGKKFQYNGERFEITDVSTRRPKRPVTAKNVLSGKILHFALDHVLPTLGRFT